MEIKLCRVPARLMRDDLERRKPEDNPWSRFIDITGDTYGLLTVVGFAGFIGANSAWLCRCACGELTLKRSAYLRYHNDKSCGCRGEIKNMASHPLYGIWRRLQQRAETDGCRVAKRWRESFAHFVADVGDRPSARHHLYRIDQSGDYAPGNCRWMEGERNRHASPIVVNGVAKSSAAWASHVGISRERMRQRIRKCVECGIDIAEAINTPPGETMPSLRK